jgi:hypothetical protein
MPSSLRTAHRRSTWFIEQLNKEADDIEAMGADKAWYESRYKILPYTR